MTNVTRRTPTRRRRRRPSTARRIARSLIIALFLAAIASTAVLGFFYASSSAFRDAANAVITRADTPAKAFPGRDSINLLFMGRDLDRDNHGRILKTRGRTDAIMLAHIDFRERTVNVLSIPRDTLVRVPGHRGKRRINSANALGGPELAMRTVDNFLRVNPDYYLLVNFSGFEKAIDSVGGLNVTVDKPLDYDDSWGNLHIHLKPGRQHLNGMQAMGFARYRKNNQGFGDSDLVRCGRQQELLRAMKSKLMQPGTIVRVPGMIDGIRDEMQGNLTTAQMVCIARFVKSLPKDHGINMVTIPAGEGSRIYVKADPEETRKIVSRLFY